METITKKVLGAVSLVTLVLASSLATGCASAAAEDAEATDEIEQGKIIGENDLTPVTSNGANIPAKYAPIINAFGVMSMGCTATHIGGGLVLSAGHCFGAPSTRKDNVPCPNVTVKWGVRRDSQAYMTSQCKIVLAEEHSRNRDYSIFRVEPAPETAIEPDLGKRPTVDTEITIFGHPQRRPLEWSKTCPLKLASVRHRAGKQRQHDPGGRPAEGHRDPRRRQHLLELRHLPRGHPDRRVCHAAERRRADRSDRDDGGVIPRPRSP
jgi:V8-like Glu-specific endopeptidase